MRKKAVVLVMNAVESDNRVLKTTISLSKLGYQCSIVGFKRNTNSSKVLIPKNKGGYEVILCNSEPILKLKGSSQIEKLKLNISCFSYIVNDVLNFSDIDLVYSHDTFTLPLAYELTEKLRFSGNARIKWVHDIHEYSEGNDAVGKEIQKFAISIERQYLERPDMLFTVSPIISERILESYNLKSAPEVLYNAPYKEWVGNKIEPIKQKLKIPKNRKLVVYTGGARHVRGLHLVVEALKDLDWLHFCAVTNGKTEYVTKLKERAKELGVENRFHIMPYVEPENIPSFLRDADYGINPILKYGNSDVALPNKLFDFIHAQVPIITSSTDTMGAFVKENKIGWSFDAGSVGSLVETFNISRSEYSEKSRSLENAEYLKNKYSWNENERLLEKYLSELT